jgi:hypothetical protein
MSFRSLLMVRFVLDCTMIGTFLYLLTYFVKVKFENLLDEGKGSLTGFNRFVSLQNWLTLGVR